VRRWYRRAVPSRLALGGILIAVWMAVAAPWAGAADGDAPALRSETSPGIAVQQSAGVPLTGEFLLLELVDAEGAVVSGPAVVDLREPDVVAAATRPGAPPPAGYRWRGLGEDGTVVGGVEALDPSRPPPSVGDPVRDATAVMAVVRALALAGPIVLLGLVVLRWWVIAGVAATGGVRPPVRGGTAPGALAVPAAMDARLRWLWWIATGAWAIGVLGTVATTLWQLRSADLAALLAARPGASLAIQAGLVLGTAVLAFVPWRASAWSLALGLPAALALLVVSASGHAWVEPDRTVAVGADALHNWATGLWVGGLVGLAVLVPAWLAALGEEDRVPAAAGVVVRFSTIAIVAVAALVVTGTYRALAELDAPGDLFDTRYGIALTVKLGLFALLLGTGAWNRLVLHPRLERAALGLREGDGGATRALRTSVLAEIALAAGVLLAVGVMVAVTPPA
jgi:copper transport protein